MTMKNSKQSFEEIEKETNKNIVLEKEHQDAIKDIENFKIKTEHLFMGK